MEVRDQEFEAGLGSVRYCLKKKKKLPIEVSISVTFFFFKANYRAGEMTQWFRALGVQEMGSVPNTRMAVYNHLYLTSVPGYPKSSADLCRHICDTYTCRKTPLHIKIT